MNGKSTRRRKIIKRLLDAVDRSIDAADRAKLARDELVRLAFEKPDAAEGRRKERPKGGHQ